MRHSITSRDANSRRIEWNHCSIFLMGHSLRGRILRRVGKYTNARTCDKGGFQLGDARLQIGDHR